MACFLVRTMQASTTFSNVKTARAAIRKFHEASGRPTPTDHELVSAVCAAAQRLLPGVRHRKTPLTVEHLQRLVASVPDGAPLPRVMVVTAVLVGFFGFLRYSDLARVWVDWVVLGADHMEIFLEMRKNDQFREGHWIAVAANPGSRVCPVYWTRLLLQRARLTGHRPLFAACDTAGQYCRTAIPYFALRRQLLDELAHLGLSRGDFGTHSLRAGGATTAADVAAELGIPDRLWQEHGGWKSASSAQVYVKTSLEAKLMPTRSMLRRLSDVAALRGPAHRRPSLHASAGSRSENATVPAPGTGVLDRYRSLADRKAALRTLPA